jgi:hypothetical protein
VGSLASLPSRPASQPVKANKEYTMPSTIKLTLAGMTATIALSFAVSGASARRIQTSEQGFLARWTNVAFNAGGNRISCPVTLEGSFHSKTTSKVCGQLIGYVTRAQIPGAAPPCVGGTATMLTETLPWHIQYNSFAGRLPSITRIRVTIVQTRFQIASGGVTCLAGSTQEHPEGGDINIGASGEGRTLTALPEFTIPLGGEFLCNIAGNGNFEGTGEVFTLATPQVRLTVRLVQ